jgi:hypothetical protein
MIGILRNLLSIGSPKERLDGQWDEIASTRQKVEELERRMRFSERYRYVLRSAALVPTRVMSSMAVEEEDV